MQAMSEAQSAQAFVFQFNESPQHFLLVGERLFFIDFET